MGRIRNAWSEGRIDDALLGFAKHAAIGGALFTLGNRLGYEGISRALSHMLRSRALIAGASTIAGLGAAHVLMSGANTLVEA